MKKIFKIIRLSTSPKKVLKNIKKSLLHIEQLFSKNIQFITYVVLFFIGMFFIILTIILNIDNNISNILTGLGTGIVTSLVISCIISKSNENIEKRRLLQNKKIIFIEIISTAIDTYTDIIYKVNEYILKSHNEIKEVYYIYKDFSVYKQFENHLKLINYEKETNETKELLNNMFNFEMFQLKYLASQLNTISK